MYGIGYKAISTTFDFNITDVTLIKNIRVLNPSQLNDKAIKMNDHNSCSPTVDLNTNEKIPCITPSRIYVIHPDETGYLYGCIYCSATKPFDYYYYGDNGLKGILGTPGTYPLPDAVSVVNNDIKDSFITGRNQIMLFSQVKALDSGNYTNYQYTGDFKGLPTVNDYSSIQIEFEFY